MFAPLVAIGGSAGSLDALVRFFEVMPEDCGIAFIVVVHLSPNVESVLPELLQRHCVLKVERAHHNQQIAANHVYVISPGRVLSQNKDRLHVVPMEPKQGRVAVINVLFKSIAAERAGPVAGILLSGADADGAEGLATIKQAGGHTLVQDPAEAAQETMPRAAIALGCADDILPAAQMPQQLLSGFGIALSLRQRTAIHATTNKLTARLTNKETQLVRAAVLRLQRRTGRDISYFRHAVVLRHVRRRMALTGQLSAAKYLKLLGNDLAEPKELLRELLVSVTSFFRDAEAFEALASYIPLLFDGKRATDFVRVWVHACATGEEAYSIAMLLQEYAETLPQPPGIQVFGCDLDASAIERARAGLYSEESVRTVSPERLARFFQAEDGSYRVRRELRQIVLFAQHDVVADPAFTCIDLVSCRNLLIYLNPDGQKRMLDVFDFALDPKGLLFLGAAEGLWRFSASFLPLDAKHRIYRRQPTPQQAAAGTATIQRSVTMEQTAYRNRANLKSLRDGPSLNQLQDQLELLQEGLQQNLRQDAPGQATQHQIQVVKQELHATLEELEINRQELRSMNAELSTVNMVLSNKLEELELANSDLNNLMNAASIPMVFLNRELRIMRYTPRALDLFRLIPSDLGRPLSDLHNCLDYPGLMADAQAILDGGPPVEHEVSEAKGKCFLARVLPYYAPQGHVDGVALTFFDITERKRSEAALQASEEKLRTFISATSDMVYEMSADWLEMRSLTGKNFVTSTDIPRRDWSEEYIPAEEMPRVWAAIRRAIRTRSTFELEHRVRRLDGSTGWVFSRAIPLLDQQGKVVKWFGAASDITERKHTEEALHESEERYRTLFESIDEGFCIVKVAYSKDGKPSDYQFLQVNPSFERQTGITNAKGRWMREIAPEHESHWFETYGRIALVGEPMRFESVAKALGRYYDVYAFRVGDPGLMQVGILFNDISERKRSDDALRDSEGRQRLALDAAGMGYFTCHPEDDRIEADSRLLALFGMPPGAALTQASAMAALVHPDDRARYDAELRHALDPAGDGKFRAEVRVVGQDGIERWLAFNGNLELGGEPRRQARLSGVVRDISAQHRAGQDLLHEAARLAFLLQLADALRPLKDPAEVEAIATRMLREHLGASQVSVAHGEAAGQESADAMSAAAVPGWVMTATARTPRKWTPGERAMLQETARRTWEAVRTATGNGNL